MIPSGMLSMVSIPMRTTPWYPVTPVITICPYADELKNDGTANAKY
jgi:hypothetical protein